MKNIIKKLTISALIVTLSFPNAVYAASIDTAKNEAILSTILGRPVTTASDAVEETVKSNEQVVSSIIGQPVQTISYSDTAIDSIDIDSVILAFRDAYPTGSAWGENDYYKWRANSVYRGGYGCAGFAYLLSDAIYGDNKAVKIEGNDNIAKYDCIELWHNEHTAFVLDYDPATGKITVVEANVDGGKVKWGTVYNRNEVSAVIKR